MNKTEAIKQAKVINNRQGDVKFGWDFYHRLNKAIDDGDVHCRKFGGPGVPYDLDALDVEWLARKVKRTP